MCIIILDNKNLIETHYKAFDSSCLIPPGSYLRMHLYTRVTQINKIQIIRRNACIHKSSPKDVILRASD